jgi:hypothetical protein
MTPHLHAWHHPHVCACAAQPTPWTRTGLMLLLPSGSKAERISLRLESQLSTIWASSWGGAALAACCLLLDDATPRLGGVVPLGTNAPGCLGVGEPETFGGPPSELARSPLPFSPPGSKLMAYLSAAVIARSSSALRALPERVLRHD